ncbi:hypothetical protein BRADI_1g11426v3 [Brachypodium distachyon]|uniref:Uncharacterized protein n=1 Tax=Brachypodium distachyon TaxID=15368 RepID=A0A2K2DJ08_BRADI|nr:hypothetical protein BRADI_1g11426v3 [Brachypodium distachyon]
MQTSFVSRRIVNGRTGSEVGWPPSHLTVLYRTSPASFHILIENRSPLCSLFLICSYSPTPRETPPASCSTMRRRPTNSGAAPCGGNTAASQWQLPPRATTQCPFLLLQHAVCSSARFPTRSFPRPPFQATNNSCPFINSLVL